MSIKDKIIEGFTIGDEEVENFDSLVNFDINTFDFVSQIERKRIIKLSELIDQENFIIKQEQTEIKNDFIEIQKNSLYNSTSTIENNYLKISIKDIKQTGIFEGLTIILTLENDFSGNKLTIFDNQEQLEEYEFHELKKGNYILLLKNGNFEIIGSDSNSSSENSSSEEKIIELWDGEGLLNAGQSLQTIKINNVLKNITQGYLILYFVDYKENSPYAVKTNVMVPVKMLPFGYSTSIKDTNNGNPTMFSELFPIEISKENDNLIIIPSGNNYLTMQRLRKIYHIS